MAINEKALRRKIAKASSAAIMAAAWHGETGENRAANKSGCRWRRKSWQQHQWRGGNEKWRQYIGVKVSGGGMASAWRACGENKRHGVIMAA